MHFENYILQVNEYIGEAIQKMNQNTNKGLIVMDGDVVFGVFTRYDLVNALHVFGINTIQMRDVANRNFFSIFEKENLQKYKDCVHSLIPIINDDNHLVDIFFPDNRKPMCNYKYPVVIMAGGLGTRLYPYTKVLPKPLVPVNGVPMVERIMDKFCSYGCTSFYLIVNYKKEMIKAYFDDVEKQYSVKYGEEKKQLGTGGGLYYIRNQIEETFFLTNCDTILLENYDEIYEYHINNRNLITMIAAVKIIEVPYGVVKVDKTRCIIKMEEKPNYGMLVNTGMYVVNKEALKVIDKEESIGFPDLIERLKEQGEKIGVYPITEDRWVDMGQVEEYQKACDLINELE